MCTPRFILEFKEQQSARSASGFILSPTFLNAWASRSTAVSSHGSALQNLMHHRASGAGSAGSLDGDIPVENAAQAN